MTNEQLAEWIDWEGGVGDLIMHGIGDETFDDPRTKELWEACEIWHKTFELASNKLIEHIGY